MASDTEVAPKNKEAFAALMEALAKAKEDNSPTIFSTFKVEDDDSQKVVQVALKIHVPQAARMQTRDFVADYLERRLDAGETFGLFVMTGTKSNPDKEQLDIVLRYTNPQTQTKPQVIRLEIKPPSGGSGGGAAQTTLQEIAQCAYTALRYTKGAGKNEDLKCDAKNAEDCIKLPELEEALKKVKQGKDNIKATDIDGMTAEWKHALILGANEIYHGVGGNNWTFLRGGGLDDGAIKKAYDRVKKASTPADNVPPNEDKWNPSDIWMVKDGVEDTLEALLKVEGTIDCLNNFFNVAFTETAISSKSTKVVPKRSLVGISLKKLGPTARFVVMNPPNVAHIKKAENIVFDKSATLNELTSFSAMDVYLCYGQGRYKSFQARNFGGTNLGQWQLELKGEFAAQGKIKGDVMRKLLARVNAANPFKSLPPKEVSFDDCKITSSKINTVVDAIYTLLDTYIKSNKGFIKGSANETAMKSLIKQKDASWRFSKVNGLKLLEWLDSLPNTGADKQADRAMKEMYLYASSQSDKSSVYYKLF